MKKTCNITSETYKKGLMKQENMKALGIINKQLTRKQGPSGLIEQMSNVGWPDPFITEIVKLEMK